MGQVLQVLRQSLRYEDLELVADAALAHRPDAPVVRRLYAQALVDGANPAVALQLYSDLAADETVPMVDRVEARGGIGRCYKEMFLLCTEPGRRRHYLTRSLDAYLTAYHEDENNTWHGINAVALLARAGREGVELAPGTPEATVLAERILQTVDADPVPHMWTEVTACEAAIALGRYDEAVERARAFLETRPDGFTVAAFLRQLQTVWAAHHHQLPGRRAASRAALHAAGGQRGRGRRWRRPTSALPVLPTSAADGWRRSSATRASCRWPGTARGCSAAGPWPGSRPPTTRPSAPDSSSRAPICTRTCRHSWWSPMVTSCPRTWTPPTRWWCSTASTTIRAGRPASG